MNLSDRFALHGHAGPFRWLRGAQEAQPSSEAGGGSSIRHAPAPSGPVRRTWWEQTRLFELEDRKALYNAISSGDEHAVRRALANRRCDPNASYKGRPPPIVHAVGQPPRFVPKDGHLIYTREDRDTGALKALLDDARVNVDQRLPESDESAIGNAVLRNDGAAVRLLVSREAQLNAFSDHWSLLGTAAKRSLTEAAIALLRSPQARVHEVQPDGLSPFTLAAGIGNDTLLQAMLEREGTNVDQPDGSGKNALVWAARNGHTETARLLLEHGAAPDKADNQGQWAASHAAANGHTQTLRLLLERSKDPQKIGLQALLHAAREEQLDCARAVIGDKRIDLTTTAAQQVAWKVGLDRPAIAKWLRPQWTAALRLTPDEIVKRMLDTPAERGQMLQALTEARNVEAVLRLGEEPKLQSDIATQVELATAQARWDDAAWLAQGFSDDGWQPGAEFLRKLTRAGQDGLTHRRELVSGAGAALLAQLQPQSVHKGSATAWQKDTKTLPARLSAMVVASLTSPGLAQAPAVEDLFKLTGLPSKLRSRVAAETLHRLQALSGDGIQRDWDSPDYGDSVGAFRFKLHGSEGRDPVTDTLVHALRAHVGGGSLP